MAPERQPWLAVVRSPNHDRPVVGAAGQEASAPAHLDSGDRALLSCRRVLEVIAAARPTLQRAIVQAGEKLRAVGTPGGRADGSVVRQDGDLLAGTDAPYA